MLVASSLKWLVIAAIIKDDNFKLPGPIREIRGPRENFDFGGPIFPKTFSGN
jgi:hypothetical protein